MISSPVHKLVGTVSYVLNKKLPNKWPKAASHSGYLSQKYAIDCMEGGQVLRESENPGWGPALSLALDKSASEPVSTSAKRVIPSVASQTCEDGIR